MIRHIVLLSLDDAHAADALSKIMTGLAALVDVVPGFTSFEHGPNRDFEQKSGRYPYGFICTFTDEAALQAYAENPEHRALGARLVAICGNDGIMVVDLEIDT